MIFLFAVTTCATALIYHIRGVPQLNAPADGPQSTETAADGAIVTTSSSSSPCPKCHPPPLMARL
ncbi:MAG: hypothetical protein AAF366_14865 [Pseudomonadota bacterium]